MNDLFFSECRRYRKAALTFAAVHLVIQMFVNRMFDLLIQPVEPHMVVLAIYMLAGLAFAMFQFGSYRQPSRWLWLLHRPLPRGAVFSAISAASFVLIALAIGLPALLTVAGTDALTTRVVDARHYLMVLHVVLLTSMAWLIGAYVMLNGRRSAIVVMVLPFLLLGHLASGYVLLVPAILCLALLACIAFGTFKPNRSAPPAGAALLATAAPLQIGFYFALVWVGSLLFQNALILAGTHPLNRPLPPAGGYTEATRAENADLLLKGLASSTDPQAPQWRRQVPLLEILNFEASADQFPVRHQISNLTALSFVDSARNTAWTFSHDDMLYHGADIFTTQDRGVFGLRGMGDRTPFPAVPMLAGDKWFITPQAVHQRDADSGKVTALLQLAAPETLAREPLLADGLLYILTNNRLIAYAQPLEHAAADAAATGTPLEQRFSIALPEPLSQLDRIDIAGLVDARLVSISFGRGMTRGAGEGSQFVYLVDAAGMPRQVAKRALAHDFPALFEHHAWWVSPALHTVLALPGALLDKGMILDHGKTRYTNELEEARPPVVWAAAGLLSLLSAAAAFFWLRVARASAPRKTLWILNCLLVGPPALACLVLLQPRDRIAHVQSAPRAAITA